MSPNAKLWLVALGAGLTGALVGAGLVWATQQSTVASLNAQVIKIEADSQAATARAEELQTELDAVKASAGQSPTASASPAPSPSVTPKNPTSKTVKQFSYVKTVTGSPAKPVITADYAQMLSGDAAAAAATARGDESPPPNDYYIVNDNKKLRKLPVQPGISVTVTTNSDGTSDPTGHVVSFADWASSFSAPTAENEALRTAPYWLTVKNGIVVKIVQQYLP